MIRSLRGVLLLETILGSASVVLVSGVVLYFLVESVLIRRFDRSLLDYVIPMVASMEQEQDVVDLDFSETDLREVKRLENPAYLHVWLDDGSELYRSASLGAANLEPIEGSREAPGFRWLTLPDGRPGRAIGFTFMPREGGAKKKLRALEAGIPWKDSKRKVMVAFARDTASITAPLSRIGLLLGCVSVVAMLITAGFLWWTIRRNLRPLSRLATQISRLDGADLSARLEALDAPLEVRPIADRMNEFLRRLEAAFVRERSLSADVAHELRTPLAGIRSTIEVALSQRRAAGEHEEALRECLGITLAMQSMVEKLLLLARVEAGQARVDPRPVLLAEQVLSAWEMLESASAARGLHVEWALRPDVEVATDPAFLHIVLHNVLENAVEYADRGGTVRIETAAGPRGAEVLVRNTGSKLTAEEAQHAFERFWRGDAAHSSACAHCGIGLVLVKNIAQALGGTVEVRSEAGGWFEVRLSIPQSLPTNTPGTPRPEYASPPAGSCGSPPGRPPARG